MALVNLNIPHLLNGVSQQADTLRLPSQCQEQINALANVGAGLGKRPPTEHIKQLTGAAIPEDSCLQLIDRGPNQRYLLVLNNLSLRIFDLDTGAEHTVSTGIDGFAYLATSGEPPNSTFRMVYNSSYALIMNSQWTTNSAGPYTAIPENPSSFLVYIKQGNYSSDYKIEVKANGVTYSASKTTLDSGAVGAPADIKTSQIASDLHTSLAAAMGVNVTANLSADEGCIVIRNVNNYSDFTVRVSDSGGNTLIGAVGNKAQAVSSLPAYSDEGRIIKIVGDGATQAYPYYVKAVVSQGAPTYSVRRCVWVETVAKDASPAPTGWPYKLTKTGATTWLLDRVDWSYRTAGDDTSAPLPSLTGSKLSDFCLWKNRLGFFSGTKVVFSRNNDNFNLFPSTVATELDTHPIDIDVAGLGVTKINWVTPFEESLVLWTDRGQLILTGDPILSRKTVKVAPATAFETTGLARPVHSGKTIFFPYFSGLNYTGFREYFTDGITGSRDAADLTPHCRKYIPLSVDRLVASSTDNVLAAMSSSNQTKLWVYNWYWLGDQKLQSGWSQFTFGAATIVGGVFVGSVLYLLLLRGSVACLEKINFAPGYSDPSPASPDYLTLLDRRISALDCTVGYNVGDDLTTWTLPYTIESGATMKVVVWNTGIFNRGRSIQLISASGNQITASGDWQSAEVFLGQTYTMSYTFSKQYLRKANGDLGNVSDVSGRLQHRHWNIVYDKTGYFQVQVTPSGRSTYTYRFTGQPIGGLGLLGTPSITSGTFKVPILCNNEEATVTVSSDSYLPCYLQSVDMVAEWVSRSRAL